MLHLIVNALGKRMPHYDTKTYIENGLAHGRKQRVLTRKKPTCSFDGRQRDLADVILKSTCLLQTGDEVTENPGQEWKAVGARENEDEWVGGEKTEIAEYEFAVIDGEKKSNSPMLTLKRMQTALTQEVTNQR